jgi:ribosomal protein S17
MPLQSGGDVRSAEGYVVSDKMDKTVVAASRTG